MAPDSSAPGSPIDPKERFFRYFQHEIIALQDQIDRLKDAPAGINGERNDMIEHCLAGIARLSHEVKDASSYVPTYDQRTYGEAIKALTTKLDTTRQLLTPRQKFTFKSVRKNPSAISLSDAAELAAQQSLKPSFSNTTSTNASSLAASPLKEEARSPAEEKPIPEFPETPAGNNSNPQIHRPAFSHTSSITISNHRNQHIVLPSSSSHATVSSGTLSNLYNCIIDLTAPAFASAFPALTLKDISQSLILCGTVSGALHITNVTSSVLLASVRQFRMHASKNTHVYLYCRSRPIIEDCERIQFAPIPDILVSEMSTFPTSDAAANLYAQVDDFKWLKATPSPHWALMPQTQWPGDAVWRRVVSHSERETEGSFKREEILKMLLPGNADSD